MKSQTVRIVVGPAASNYLQELTEPWQVEAGTETLETPHGPIEALGRALVAEERITLFAATPEVGTEDYCRRLAHLALGPLAGDVLVFVDSRGRAVDTPLRGLAAPGDRRHFHLSLLLAEADGRLGDTRFIESVLSEALRKEVRTNPAGLNTLDDAMRVVARPHPDLPTLAVAARAVGLFLGASSGLPGSPRILGDRLPVFEYRTPYGPLRLRAGEAAREALLQPEVASLLAATARGLGATARNPSLYPSEPLYRWIQWAWPEEPPRSPEGIEAAELARGRRQALLDEGRLGRAPEVCRTWRCPTCGRLHSKSQALEEGPLHLQWGLLWLRQAVDASSREVPCACGAALDQASLVHAFFGCYLVWPGGDLRLEVERLADGRLVESWGWAEPAGAHRALPGEPSPETMQEVLGRRDSLSSCWVSLMEGAARSGRVEAAPAGRLTWLVVLPPGKPEETASRLEELLAPAGGRRRQVVNLSGTPAEAPASYRTWAGEFKARLEDGTFGSAALVDWPGYLEMVLSALREDGLEPQVDPQKPDRLLLSDLGSWAALDLGEELAAGVRAGRYPEEVALGAVQRGRHELSEMQRAVGLARGLVPQASLKLDHVGRRLEVQFPEGAQVEVDVGAALASPEGLERALRFQLCPEVPTLDVCRCGQPSHLACRIRSPQWVEALPGGKASRLARRQVPGVPQLYVRACSHHLWYLEWAELERMGLGQADLEPLLERDLDRTGATLRVLSLDDPLRAAVAFVGPEAASLACHPGLVAGAFEAAGVELPEVLDLEATDLDVLLATEPGLAPDRQALLAQRALALLGREAAGGALAVRLQAARSAPRGRFRIEEVEQIPV